MPHGRSVSALSLKAKDGGFDRADIEFQGVDQSGPSFEARVFLNNPGATAETPLTPESGYAGSFHVYGYGGWPADVGQEKTESDGDPEGIRAPIDKSVIATDAVRQAASKGSDVTVTVVPVAGDPPQDASEALKFKDVRIKLQ
jgi:hypothetical protein